MRYASALMLAALAIGEVAAASNPRHASFHARRNAESKREADEVDWENVAYDFSGVDFNTVDYGNGAKTSSTAAVAAPAASSYHAAPAEPTAAAGTQEKASAADSSADSPVGDVVSDITAGIDSFLSSLKVKPGLNSKTMIPTGVWLGDDGDYKATFTNDGDSTVALFCWTNGTMWINEFTPAIAITLGAGQKQTMSFAEGYSGGCGAATSESTLSYGQLNESILELTTISDGGKSCFDISREINMKGLALSAKGSMCTSGLDGDNMSCTFVCTNGADKCGNAGEYAIDFGSANDLPKTGGCMSNTGPVATDGGCQMSGPGEHLQITIYGHRTWPALSI